MIDEDDEDTSTLAAIYDLRRATGAGWSDEAVFGAGEIASY